MINYNIILFIFLIVIVISVFLYGYSYSINKQNKIYNKKQDKINTAYKIKNKKELIEKLKKSLFLFVLLFFNSCNKSYKVYIPLQEYNELEQLNLIEFLEYNDNKLIDRILIDYGNLRELVKINNEN